MDSAAACNLVMELMSIPGRSREERAVLNVICDRLTDAGVPKSRIEFDTAYQRIPGGGETGNLIVKLPGTVDGPRRLLMAHVDTVPICVGCDPCLDGDQIRSRNPNTGLGGDNRAGAAVIMTAVIEILRQKLPHPPLTLFFPVQEEIGLNGARYVSTDQLGSPEYCFNWDGGDPSQVCIGATGDYAILIDIEGVASHAGVSPEKGVSAIAIAALAISHLHRDGWHGLVQKGEHRGSSNVGFIQAGEATNVVTPHLTLKAEARSHDREFRKTIVEAYRRAFEFAAAEVKSSEAKAGRVKFQSDLKYESFCLPADCPTVKLAMSAVSKVGLSPTTRIGNGGLDANWMTAHGLQTVTLGCGQREIHTIHETLNVTQFLQACQTAILLASGQD